MGVRKKGSDGENRRREISMIRVCLRNLELVSEEEDKLVIGEIRAQLECLENKNTETQATFF